MEDLFGFILFILFVVVNLIAQANKKKNKTPPKSGETAPRSQPKTLEDFFDEIARKFEPEPTKLPEWPEDIQRPDYVKEMKEYENAKTKAFEEVEPIEAVPMPPPISTLKTVATPIEKVTMTELRSAGRTAMFKLPVQGAVFSGMGSMRISTPPLLRSATGTTHFTLEGRDKLKQALIANMVFGPPRAYDTSFDNTIAN